MHMQRLRLVSLMSGHHVYYLRPTALILPPLQRIALSMVSQKKKYTSCAAILVELAQISFTKSRPVAIPVSGKLTGISFECRAN